MSCSQLARQAHLFYLCRQNLPSTEAVQGQSCRVGEWLASPGDSLLALVTAALAIPGSPTGLALLRVGGVVVPAAVIPVSPSRRHSVFVRGDFTARLLHNTTPPLHDKQSDLHFHTASV